MAKKKSEPSPATKIERALQEALDALNRQPFVAAMSEKDYCEAVLDALDGIKTGLEMRAQELADGEDDG